MKLSEVFNNLGRLMSVYGKMMAVTLEAKDGKLEVGGVHSKRVFGFSADIDGGIDNFSFIAQPEVFSTVYALTVTDVKSKNGNLEVSGQFGSEDNAPVITITCEAGSEQFAAGVRQLKEKALKMVGQSKDKKALCAVSDVVKPWLSLAGCGDGRLNFADKMTYTIGAGTSAFFASEGKYTDLQKHPSGEPLQMDSVYASELQAMESVFGAKLNIYYLETGAGFFVAADEDGSAFALSSLMIPLKHRYPKAEQLFESSQKFEKTVLPQNAVRDIVIAAADKMMVGVETLDGKIAFDSGAVGTIKIDVGDVECNYEAMRQHAIDALRALPTDGELKFGAGESGGSTFCSFSVDDVTVIFPVQDKTEV